MLDIAEQKEKLILGLVGTIIVKYQIGKYSQKGMDSKHTRNPKDWWALILLVLFYRL
jgi:hypothetical protein